jgi:hypothetical protein
MCYCLWLGSGICPPRTIPLGPENAFIYCDSLQSVTIPESVTFIEDNPFAICPARVINHSKHFTLFEGNLYSSDRKKLIAYLSKDDSFIVPDFVTVIGKYAFKECTSLLSVTIPDSVTSIEEDAFLLCTSLKSINIPDSVKSIGLYIFDGCDSLRTISVSHNTYDRLKIKLQHDASIFKFTD